MTFDTSTALVVVDCQNDFADPEGSLYVVGAADVISHTNRLIIQAVAAGSPVYYTQDWHPESTPHFQKDGGIWPVHCVAETWGAQLHPRLIDAGPKIRKGVHGEDGYSGFTMRDPETGNETPTRLNAMLESAGVERVVVAGLALDYCVKATALDSVGLGYHTELPLRASAAVEMEPGDADRAQDELSEVGVELT
ncbi:MAG: isochorismatase family protein [Acidimicrobiia bacterium]